MGRGGSGWSNNGHGMRLYPRENIAPLVGALNSTEDQAARFRALIGAHHLDGLLELAQSRSSFSRWFDAMSTPARNENPPARTAPFASPSSLCKRGGTVCSVNSFCPALGPTAIR